MLEKFETSASHPSRLTVLAAVLLVMGAFGLLSVVWSAVSEIPRQLGAVHVSGRVTGNGSRNILRYARGRPNGLIVYYITFTYEAEGGSYEGTWDVPDDEWLKKVPAGTPITVAYLPGEPSLGQPVGDLFGGDYYSLGSIIVRLLFEVMLEGILSIGLLFVGFRLLRYDLRDKTPVSPYA